MIFTLVYGYIAAHNEKAEKVMVPVLDILQSIPVLSFLPAVVLGLIALFPNAHVGVMSGLLELIDDNGGKMDIYQLGGDLMMEIDDLLPNIEGISMLNFAQVREGDIFITDLGKEFVEADIDESKELFKKRLESISIFRLIMKVLNNKKNHTMKEEFFKELYKKHFPQHELEEIMDIIIAWGRYAELFNYDYDSEELYLEKEEVI